MKLNELVSQKQLTDVEKFADALWGKLGIDVKFTKHFIERLADPRNGKEISAAELIRLFKKEYEQNGKAVKALAGEDEAVFMDLLTSVNLPFVFKDRNGKKEIDAKTIIRKPDFKSPDPVYKVK